MARIGNRLTPGIAWLAAALSLALALVVFIPGAGGGIAMKSLDGRR